jgi:hypothetical protein
MELGSGNNFLHAQGGVRMIPPWQPTRNSGNAVTMHYRALGSVLASSDSSVDGGDSEILAAGPGDWDADFRDEHLLEDDSSIDSGFGSSSGMGPPDGVMGSGGARLGPGPGSRAFSGPGNGLSPGSFMGHPHPLLQSGVPSSHTVSRTVQCQNGDGSQVLLQNSSQGFKSGYGRTNVAANKLGPFSPNQTSPSRLGQQQQQVPQTAHLQYWQQQQHAHLYPANHPQTHLHNAQRANSFQSTTNFKTLSSGPVGQRYAAGEVVSSNSLTHPNLQFHQQQQFLSSQQQSADYQSLPNSPSSLSQRSHIPVEVDSTCNSPGGLLPSPQIESRWGYESSSSTGAGSSSNSGGYGGDGSPAFAHQAIFLPQHHFYSNNLFNGRKPGLPLVGVVRPPVAPVQRDYRFAK